MSAPTVEHPISPPTSTLASYVASKTKVQLGCITAFAVMALLILAACGKQDSFGEKLRGLVIDPNTHTLAATSGAVFCAMVAITGLGIWGLLDNKEERFACWVKGLFANKTEEQAGILIYAAVVLTLALPFILLAAQGCHPFKEGGENFQDFLFGKSTHWFKTGGAILTFFVLGVLAPLAISYALMSDNTEVPEGQEWIEKKSLWQKFSLIGITWAALTWGVIFSMLAAKGVAPFDQGWENFKHLLCDHTTQVVDALPAVGIITGLGVVAGVQAWAIAGSKDSGKKVHSVLKSWWEGRAFWQKAIVTLTTLLFIAAIPLIIMQAKGVGIHQAIVGDSINPSLEVALIALLLIAATCSGFIWKF